MQNRELRRSRADRRSSSMSTASPLSIFVVIFVRDGEGLDAASLQTLRLAPLVRQAARRDVRYNATN